MKMKTPNNTDTDSEPTTDIDITMTPDELGAVVEILRFSEVVFNNLTDYFGQSKDSEKSTKNYKESAALSKLLHDQFAGIANKIETKQRVLH